MSKRNEQARIEIEKLQEELEDNGQNIQAETLNVDDDLVLRPKFVGGNRGFWGWRLRGNRCQLSLVNSMKYVPCRSSHRQQHQCIKHQEGSSSTNSQPAAEGTGGQETKKGIGHRRQRTASVFDLDQFTTGAGDFDGKGRAPRICENREQDRDVVTSKDSDICAAPWFGAEYGIEVHGKVQWHISTSFSELSTG